MAWEYNPANTVVFDIEADGLLFEATKIHCIVIKTSMNTYLFYDDIHSIKSSLHNRWGGIADGIRELKNFINDSRTLVGHNICGFDLPLIKKLGLSRGTEITPWNSQILDTMSVSQVLSPETENSLEYWGGILGTPKIEHNDWTQLSEDMLTRCIGDVELNWKLYEYFGKNKGLYKTREIKGKQEPIWQSAVDLEQKVLWIHSGQVLSGVLFDTDRAIDLYNNLSQEFSELEIEVQSRLPWIQEKTKGVIEVSKPFNANGSLSTRAMKYVSDNGPHSSLAVGPFSRVGFRQVNVKSPDELKGVLLGLGWEPTEWNYKKGTKEKSSPKLTEESYDSLPTGLGKDIAHLLTLKHRMSFLVNEKDCSKGAIGEVRSDGRLPAEGITCGTPTARYRHSGKVVNLPRVSSPYGKELRELFKVPEGMVMVGSDLKGIEARLMGHYSAMFDGGALINVLLQEDIHTYNARTLGISRNDAKIFLYSLSYGAGPEKLSKLLKIPVSKARKLVKEYWRINKGLDKIRELLVQSFRRNQGFIYGLDGRKVFIRSDHKLLNSLIQSSAAIIFKRWMVLTYEWYCGIIGVLIKQLIAYHDELEHEVTDSPANRDWIEKNLKRTAKAAGEFYDIKIPIECDVKFGGNYAEVH